MSLCVNEVFKFAEESLVGKRRDRPDPRHHNERGKLTIPREEILVQLTQICPARVYLTPSLLLQIDTISIVSETAI